MSTGDSSGATAKKKLMVAHWLGWLSQLLLMKLAIQSTLAQETLLDYSLWV